MSKLRVGVIGMGIMGEHYVRVLRESPLGEPAAIASSSPEKLKRIGDQFGVALRAADHREWLDRVDAVIVATPDFAHRDATIDALKAGKKVLVEKPMTSSLEEAEAIIAAEAASRGGWVMVNFNHRFLSGYHSAFAACRDGKIGKPVSGFARKNDTIYVPTKMISWAARTTCAWFLNSHDIDLMRWFFGSEAQEAYAAGVKKVLVARGIDTYDSIFAQVKFADGSVACFESGWIYPNSYPTLTDSFVQITGTDGVIQIDRTKETMAASYSESYQYPKVYLSNAIFGRLQGSFPLSVNHFVSCAASGEKPPITSRDGRQVTAILDAIHRSLQSGRPEPVR